MLCVSLESVFGIPRLLLPIWKKKKKITVKPKVQTALC